MTEERLWTVQEVADYLKLNRLVVYSYINAKELKAYKIGKASPKSHWRIKQSDLDKFVVHLNGKEHNEPTA